MVVTILEAVVALEDEAKLKSIHLSSINHLDKGIVETFLLEGTKDSHVWRIITIWKDKESLQAMRESGQTPRGVEIFKEANAVATLTVFDVVAHR